MPARRPPVAALLALWVVLPAGVAAQGLIGVTAGQGQVGASAEAYSTGVAGTPAASSGDFREWILVPLAGSLVDRRVFTWAATLQPTLQQRVQTGFDRTLRARQLNLALLGRLFADRPLHLTGNLTRATAVTTGGFGTRREGSATQFGGDLAWRNPWLPLHLAAFQRTTADQWRNGPATATFRTDQRISSLRASASNSKLALEAHRFRVEDRIGGGTLEALALAGRHTLRWGKGSSLHSSLERQEEDGLLFSRRSAWSEQLRLQHTRRLATSWFYRRGTAAVGANRSVGQGWGGGVDLRVTSWASLGVDGARQTGTSGPTRETYATLTPRAGINLALPARARLTASAAVGREFRRREGPLAQGVPVVDEPHTVPVARRITLDELDVVPGSIVLRDGSGTTVYVEGTDYTLGTAGRFTVVDLPPTGRVQVGDALRVTYRYYPPATGARGDAWRVEYEGTLQVRGLSLRHRRSLRALEHGAVANGLLPAGSDFDDRTTAVALRTGTPAGRVDLEGTRRDTDRFGLRSTEHTVTAGFAPPPLQGAQLAFSATWNQLRAGPTRVRALSGLVSLMTAPATWLRVQAGVEAYDWRQSGLEDQRFLSGRVGADATVGQLELSLAAEAHRREFVVTNLTRRVTLRVLRRF